jgi:hypothetical protein
MSANARSPWGRWARRGAWAGLVLTLALPLAAYLVDVGLGREVLLIAPHESSLVALNRSLWSPGEPVAEIYGNPLSEPVRVLLRQGAQVLHPEEDPALALLPVASEGARVIQIQTLWWAVRLAEAGFAATTAALLGFYLFTRRRERQALAAPAA